MSAKTLNLSRAVVRSFTTTASRRGVPNANIDKGYFEIKKVQEHFQKKDGKPVFLKGSFADMVMYRLTMAISLVGVGGIAKLFWDLSVPKKE